MWLNSYLYIHCINNGNYSIRSIYLRVAAALFRFKVLWLFSQANYLEQKHLYRIAPMMRRTTITPPMRTPRNHPWILQVATSQYWIALQPSSVAHQPEVASFTAFAASLAASCTLLPRSSKAPWIPPA